MWRYCLASRRGTSCIFLHFLFSLAESSLAHGRKGERELTSKVLSRYLAYRHTFDPTHLRGKRILELGSGTGLVGIATGLIEPETQIWVTDQMYVGFNAPARSRLTRQTIARPHETEYRAQRRRRKRPCGRIELGRRDRRRANGHRYRFGSRLCLF